MGATTISIGERDTGPFDSAMYWSDAGRMLVELADLKEKTQERKPDATSRPSPWRQ